jgi:hypothetical protein
VCTRVRVLAACDQALHLTEFAHGAIERKCTIAVGSETRNALDSWLSSNKSGWKHTFATYAPGLLVEGRNFSINVQDAQVIVANEGDQHVRSVKSSELSFLSCGDEE